MTKQRADGHEYVTDCGRPECGGSCFICCCGYCKHCGLAEGALTSECPGVESYKTHADDVYAGRKDFRGGRWVDECSPHSPAFYRNGGIVQ